MSEKRLLTIDFETSDPYIGRNLGSGWTYGINVEGSDFEVLGAAVRTHEGEVYYETDHKKIEEIVRNHDVLIMHNAQYDLGCLYFLGIDTSRHDIYDTEVMSRLLDSSLQSHSLDALAKKYLGLSKNDDVLINAAWNHDLYPWLKRELNEKAKAEKIGEQYVRQMPERSKLVKFCKENMKLIQETDLEAMAEYACDDAIPTYRLYTFFIERLDRATCLKYSSLARICCDYRKKGVRVDLDRAREVRAQLIPIIADKYREVYRIAGGEFNINSPKEVPAVLHKLGIDYPRNPKTGNPSVTTPWMENQQHPICKAIIEARKAVKIDRDFIQKIIDMQEFTCPDALPNGTFGRIYPELHLLRARTGRFSCTSPNIQQIPSRDEIYGPLCRSIFVPEDGEKWYSLDFSNQEGRLQVHYAYLLRCEGADILKLEFDKDPNLDMHQKVADLAEITRKEAKTINLGLSYGMGIKKLANSLDIPEDSAILLRERYNNLSPFLSQLSKKCKEAMEEKGFIKTVGGRRSANDAPIYVDGEKRTFEYKALNKLIQGSAADQTIEAMIWAHREGIPVLFPVHDELCMSGTYKQAERLKHIMENAVQLTIPSVTEIAEGNNWSECK